MPPAYRVAEVCVYALINFLPFLVLALYPFRGSLRFSRPVIGVLIALLSLTQMGLGLTAAFNDRAPSGLLSAVSTLLYAAFYFLAVKKPAGKTLFTLLMLSNLANFAVVSAKCLEGQLFPALAVQSYRWSFSLLLLLVDCVIGAPLFFYMKRVYTPAVAPEPSGFVWHYLWLIPATFYLTWYYVVYGTGRSSLEMALQPSSALFLLLINVGAGLIYSVVARLVLEQKKTMDLQEQNHILTMQGVQYAYLQDRMAQARRARHDVRHHIAVMEDYATRGDTAALLAYLQQYSRSLPDDGALQYCENPAANAVLVYFARRAAEAGVDYTVRAAVPLHPGVAETDLSVLFGNLLENALEAVAREQTDHPAIRVLADTKGGTLCLTVENTFTGTLRRGRDGALLSAKPGSAALGHRSVTAIAEKYGGTARWESDGARCTASVLLFSTPSSAKNGEDAVENV